MKNFICRINEALAFNDSPRQSANQSIQGQFSNVTKGIIMYHQPKFGISQGQGKYL